MPGFGRGPRLKIESVKYHRNGSAGEGFHCVRFFWADGKVTHRCLATLFMRDDAPTRQYAVVDLDDPEFKIDGPWFVEALERAIEATSDAEIHSWPPEMVKRIRAEERLARAAVKAIAKNAGATLSP